jgi:Uma2 family endonuclease
MQGMSAVLEEPILKVTPEMAGTRMSPEEFDVVEEWDEDYCYELVQGVLVVVPPPSEGERGPNELLGNWLWYFQNYHPYGSALDYTLSENVVRTPGSRRRADRVIWAGLGRLPNVNRDRPTIAVEFVSAGKRNVRRDYVQKRDEYLEEGIREYWIIDRFRRRLTVYRREGDEILELVIGEHEVYGTPLLPGFELPLAKLLKIADALDQAATDEDGPG